MNRGTAVTAPLALAHFIFLPVAYSMIFHRGVPNFSYAQAGAEDNISTLWLTEGSNVEVDEASVEMNATADTSPNGLGVDEVENVTTLRISGSSTETADLGGGAVSWTLETDDTTHPTSSTMDVSVLYSSSTIDYGGENNASTPWVADSSTTMVDSDPVKDVNENGYSIYVKDGEDWNGTCQSGKMQSPIHITTFTAEVNPEAQPIIFVNYDLASLEAVVTPHTIKFDVKPNFPGYRIGIAGGGLMGFYELNHIHLHWSSSEHSIDLKAFKMEAHLVHFKMPYGNLTEDEVLDEPDGIAVLAVLFELGSADPIVDDLIRSLGRNFSQAEMPRVMPKSFLPDNTDEYIRYRGSLTTPPCSEVVIWTIFPTPKTLTEYQVKWLSTRKLSEGVPDPENYRPVQDRNDREIVLMKASYTINIIPGRLESPGSSASYGAPSICLLLASVLCFTFRSR